MRLRSRRSWVQSAPPQTERVTGQTIQSLWGISSSTSGANTGQPGQELEGKRLAESQPPPPNKKTNTYMYMSMRICISLRFHICKKKTKKKKRKIQRSRSVNITNKRNVYVYAYGLPGGPRSQPVSATSAYRSNYNQE